MDSHDFCRGMLRHARGDAKAEGVELPQVSSAWLALDSYAVFIGSGWYEEFDACCAFYARAEAITQYLGKEQTRQEYGASNCDHLYDETEHCFICGTVKTNQEG